MKAKPILVIGASGYLGSRLVSLLLERGYRVRATSRNPVALRERTWAIHPHLEITGADAADPESVQRVCAGCDIAYYLTHSMNPGQNELARADRDAAGNMAWAAGEAGLSRLIYLGGLGEDIPHQSKHLRSRADVDHVLRTGSVPVTTLRSAMIVGSGSPSFEILRYLVERLPVMITPSWVHTKIQPISICDVLEYLVGCLIHPDTIGQSFDIGGPESLTYREIMDIYAEEVGLTKRLFFAVPFLTPRLTSYWIHLITPIHAHLALPFVEGLRNETVCQDNRIQTLIPIQPHDMRTTIRNALSHLQYFDLTHTEEAWKCLPPEWAHPGDPGWAGGPILLDQRSAVARLSPHALWEPIRRIGGETGWYYANTLWRIRGFMDLAVGGLGFHTGRDDPERIQKGDRIDFWRVKNVAAGKWLLLEAEMKLPGHAELEFRIRPLAGGTSELRQTALFIPRGLLGIMYWYLLAPLHYLIFPGMLSRIIEAAKNHTGGPDSSTEETPFARSGEV